MRHAHADLINKWLNDTSQKIETYLPITDKWGSTSIAFALSDNDGKHIMRFVADDPYAELKQAQEDGKRVVWQSSEGDWTDVGGKGKWNFNYPVGRYKIIPYDQSYTHVILTAFGSIPINISKSELTGKITTKVME